MAAKVCLDALTKENKAIDDMTQFLKEKEDEIKYKDFGVEELNTNQLQTEKKDREEENLIAKCEDLEMTKTFTAKMNTLKSEVAEMQVQMKQENIDF